MFNRLLFQAAVQNKLARDGLSLRDAANQTGISISTLSRVTNGKPPDMDSFSVLIKWLGADANTFLEYSPNCSTIDKDDHWVKLRYALQELGVPVELTEAIVTLIRAIKKNK